MSMRFRSMVEVNTSTRAQVSEPAADAKVEEKLAAAPQVKQEVEDEVSVAPAPTRTGTRGMQSPDRSAPASTRTMGTRRTRAAKAEKADSESSSEPIQGTKVNTRRSRRGATAKAKVEEEDGMVTPATQRLHSLVQKMTDIEV